MKADNISGDDLLAGRKKIRAIVHTRWNKTETDIRWEAAEAMRERGAVDIRDFKSVKPLPADYKKAGVKKGIRVFTATAHDQKDLGQ